MPRQSAHRCSCSCRHRSTNRPQHRNLLADRCRKRLRCIGTSLPTCEYDTDDSVMLATWSPRWCSPSAGRRKRARTHSEQSHSSAHWTWHIPPAVVHKVTPSDSTQRAQKGAGARRCEVRPLTDCLAVANFGRAVGRHAANVLARGRGAAKVGRREEQGADELLGRRAREHAGSRAHLWGRWWSLDSRGRQLPSA
jgi:hypothetical protein